ncbi:MAG: zinc-binding dehydrogenase, partial [Chloroflexota bacterium]
MGAGTIGLQLIAALRALGCKAKIIVSARYDFQAKAAKKLGADQIFQGGDLYTQMAEAIGGKLHKPLVGKRVMVGGVDRVYECVGKDSTVDDAMRLTRANGKVILVGVPGAAKGIEWTAIFS